MTGGPSQFARVLKHVDANMAANDLAPEIIPAEAIQADEHPMHNAFPVRLAIPLAFGLAVILTIVGASV